MDGLHCFGLQQCVMIRILLFEWLFMVIWEKIMLNQWLVFKKKHKLEILILSYMLVSLSQFFELSSPFFERVGDMAYDMNVDNARFGDQYMNAIESIAGYIPYMTCPGNHENA